jgi:hypothetical protein
MKNIVDLRRQLAEVFAELRSGDMEPKQAIEINNCAGKIINSLKVQLDYHDLRGEKPEVDFLECAETEAAPESLAKSNWPSVRRHTLEG